MLGLFVGLVFSTSCQLYTRGEGICMPEILFLRSEFKMLGAFVLEKRSDQS